MDLVLLIIICDTRNARFNSIKLIVWEKVFKAPIKLKVRKTVSQEKSITIKDVKGYITHYAFLVLLKKRYSEILAKGYCSNIHVTNPLKDIDCIDHEIIITKWKVCGFGDDSLNCICSCFND